MREILPGILTWPWFSERHGYDFNGYLLCLTAGNLCVDPVEMPDEVLAEIAAAGVERIVLTNRNHFRASMKVKQRTRRRPDGWRWARPSAPCPACWRGSGCGW